MVTWTTYGSRLQGDRRGYMKDGQVLPGDENIKLANMKLQKYQTVILSRGERETIRRTILDEASRRGQKVHAISVQPKHVHLVAEPCKDTIEEIVSRYKNRAASSLRRFGRPGRLWTKGFNKRFCYTSDELAARIDYVQNHP